MTYGDLSYGKKLLLEITFQWKWNKSFRDQNHFISKSNSYVVDKETAYFKIYPLKVADFTISQKL